MHRQAQLRKNNIESSLKKFKNHHHKYEKMKTVSPGEHWSFQKINEHLDGLNSFIKINKVKQVDKTNPAVQEIAKNLSTSSYNELKHLQISKRDVRFQISKKFNVKEEKDVVHNLLQNKHINEFYNVL